MKIKLNTQLGRWTLILIVFIAAACARPQPVPAVTPTSVPPAPQPTVVAQPTPDVPIRLTGKIAFGRTGTVQILDFDRQTTPVISEEGFVYDSPSWAPDGQRLAIVRYLEPGNPDITIITPVEGTDEYNGESFATDESQELEPAWSPDGRWIAFISDRNGDFDAFYMSVDASEEYHVRLAGSDERSPSWHPNGKWIAFSTNREGSADIWFVDITKVEQNLGTIPANTPEWDEIDPAWSPDGSEIAFSSNRDGDFDIYIVNPQGDVIQISNLEGDEFYPVWTPDGLIAFSQRGNLYVALKDGSTINLGEGVNVDWWWTIPTGPEA